MSDDKDQLRDSQYDGIQEYDNDLPKWWVGTFVITVVFSFCYWIYYHNFGGQTQEQRFEEKYKQHLAMYEGSSTKEELTDESLFELVSSTNDVSEGQNIYAQNCVVCHAANGGGGIGPNLTDAYWIHGANPVSIFHTVENGVVEKGMLAWKGVLTSKQMQQVVAYVLTLKNTNVAGGKEAQGEKVQE
ncbi:MAG: c-type cytochrome [Bdellovibrionales bacterium]|nr:c-type cytochrome [Bdellovibrionales bacterium]